MAIDGLGGPRGYDHRSDRLEKGPNASENPADSLDRRDGDRIEVSTAAQRISGLADRARSLPDVRQDRVDELRRAVSDGTYKVDARQVAGAILEFEDGIGD